MRRERTKVFVNQSNLVIRKMSDINDVDLSNLEDGALLVYEENTGKWTANKNLEKQQINGGFF